MNHNIQIFRPTDRRSAFDGLPEGERALIHETTYKSDRDDWAGDRIAEKIFHILNAPEEMLKEDELVIANNFRAEEHYSLSTGDVVDVDGISFLCESFGWKEVRLTYLRTQDTYLCHY